MSRLFLKPWEYNKGLLKVWWKQGGGRGGEQQKFNVLTKIHTSPDPSEGRKVFLGEFHETKVLEQ